MTSLVTEVGTRPLFTVRKDGGGKAGQLGSLVMKPRAWGYPFPNCWAGET